MKLEGPRNLNDRPDLADSEPVPNPHIQQPVEMPGATGREERPGIWHSREPQARESLHRDGWICELGISKEDIVMPEAPGGPFPVLVAQLAGFLCSASSQIPFNTHLHAPVSYLQRSSERGTKQLLSSPHPKIRLSLREQTSQGLDPRIHVYSVTLHFLFLV